MGRHAEAWTTQARAGLDVYRDALNTPAFLAMLPAVDGLDGLDVGCGEGSNTRQVARRGARMSAIDVAPTFVRYARAAEAEDPLGIAYTVGDGMALPFAAGRYAAAVQLGPVNVLGGNSGRGAAGVGGRRGFAGGGASSADRAPTSRRTPTCSCGRVV